MAKTPGEQVNYKLKLCKKPVAEASKKR